MTVVLRSDDMRRRNRLRIIQIVRRKGAVSRGEIAQSAALSAATVSTISSDLIAEGVLVARGSETGASAGRGRPSVNLSINPQFRHAVLIILKIGAVNVTIIDYAGTVIAHQDFHLDMANLTMHGFPPGAGFRDPPDLGRLRARRQPACPDLGRRPGHHRHRRKECPPLADDAVDRYPDRTLARGGIRRTGPYRQ